MICFVVFTLLYAVASLLVNVTRFTLRTEKGSQEKQPFDA